MRYVGIVFLVQVLAATGATTASAQDSLSQPLIVGTKAAPPFAMQNENGEWHGISIELWQGIAERLDLSYEFQEFDLPGLLAAVEGGEIDAAVAALTVTPQRETQFDFSHPFYTTGLGIAALSGQRRGWAPAMGRLVSPQFLSAVGALGLLLFAVGILMWLIERKRNAEQFGGGAARGIGSGFWWSAVTMTTVGYGDKSPVTVWGRLVGLVWMFTGIIMISGFTAAITSSLTITQLESKIRGPEDLGQVRVVSVPGSTSAEYLQRNRLGYQNVGTPSEGLQAVASGRADAVVYDAPILKHLVKTEFPNTLEVLPKTFERQDYGIGFPQGSSLREAVNRALLEYIRTPEWQDLLYRHLGG